MGSGKGGGSVNYISGWKYFLTQLYALCHKIDALLQIRFSDKVAWEGEISSGRIVIDEEDLFGGEDGEGGVAGKIDLHDGSNDQDGPAAYLALKTDTPHPAYRGIVTVLFRDFMLASKNPYPKKPIFIVRQTSSDFLPALSKIGDGSKNPTHIIYDTLTSGGGQLYHGLQCSIDNINTESFAVAAQKLYDENFGLDGCWDSESENVEDFIKNILEYIDGVLDQEPTTGQLVLKLIRGDYDADSLPIYDESTISELTDLTRESPNDLVNQVLLTWTEINFDDGDVTCKRTAYAQDLGNMQLTGQVNPKTYNFPYVTNGNIAQKIAERICMQKSHTLAAFQFKGNLNLSDLRPGDVFKFSWAFPTRTIKEMVLRVSSVKIGSLTENAVTIVAGEDIHGLSYTIVSGPGERNWTNPIQGPTDCPYRQMIEIPYYVAVKDLFAEDELTNSLAEEPETGIAALLASRPSGSCMGLILYEYDPEEVGYVRVGLQYFSPTGLLSASLSETDTEISVESTVQFSRLATGDILQIETELVLIKEYDEDAGTMVVSRGVLDTVPQPHAAGARFWGAWDKSGNRFYAYSSTQYLEAETAKYKGCPKTARGTLAVSEATENTLTLAARAIRPYPPANVKINGVYYPSGLEDLQPIVVTWDNRNRLDQTGYVIEQDEGNIDPEDGTTVNIYLYDAASGSLIHSATGVAATSRTWTYAIATEIAERDTAAGNAMVCKIESERDGYTSWQKWDIDVPARLVFEGVCILTEAGNYIVTESGKYLTME